MICVNDVDSRRGSKGFNGIENNFGVSLRLRFSFLVYLRDNKQRSHQKQRASERVTGVYACWK